MMSAMTKTRIPWREQVLLSMEESALKKAARKHRPATIRLTKIHHMIWFRDRGWVVESHTPRSYATGDEWMMSKRLS